MTSSYNISYLHDAMDLLGSMLDYAVNTCGEDLNLFYARFLASGIAEQISKGNPKYLAGKSGIELAVEVAQKTGKSIPGKAAFIDLSSREYWTGCNIAYIQWNYNTDFSNLQDKGVTIEELYRRYPTLHEADISKTDEFVESILSVRGGGSYLKSARKSAGFTQEMLSFQTGVSLRAIRAYEQGQLSLSNAGAENLLKISRAIGCPISSLIPII
ncbi:MAG: helix-turn-helix transcriptional regulator [Bacteroidales bacterium]|nr:helix-turn-helix transcriptional regulator [Bacteroidales bacterium]